MSGTEMVHQRFVVAAGDIARAMTRENIEAAILAVPVVDLAEANYGAGACTTWADILTEHEDADEDEKPHTTYTMLCEGAERVRALLLKAAAQ